MNRVGPTLILDQQNSDKVTGVMASRTAPWAATRRPHVAERDVGDTAGAAQHGHKQ